MHLLITALSASQGPSGICRHAWNLFRCASRGAENSRIYLLVGTWQEEYFKDAFALEGANLTIIGVDIANNSVSRNVWYLRKLPVVAAELKVDLVHLSFPVPILKRVFNCPVVVSLHDLYPYDEPENFGFPNVLFNRLFLRRCLKEVDVVVCVSESTLSRLKVWFPRAAARKGVVIHNCIEGDVTNPAEEPLGIFENRRLFLMVAQHRPNKNILLALKVFSELLRRAQIAQDTILCVVGNEGPETSSIKNFIKDGGIEKNVRLLSGMTDRLLAWFYKNCEMLLAPSKIEGFGLPVGEAIFYGCRVVCADIPAFREIAGDACHYFDVHAACPEAAMMAAMRSSLAAPPPVPRLMRFSVESISEKLGLLYERTLQNVADVKEG
jgi:glycosyltransferase involved in cell wall biosynthesis